MITSITFIQGIEDTNRTRLIRRCGCVCEEVIYIEKEYADAQRKRHVTREPMDTYWKQTYGGRLMSEGKYK